MAYSLKLESNRGQWAPEQAFLEEKPSLGTIHTPLGSRSALTLASAAGTWTPCLNYLLTLSSP